VTLRNSILVIEIGKAFSSKLGQGLREKGLSSIRIEKSDGFVPLLDSRDLIRALVFIDDTRGIFEECYMNLKILKAMSRDMPLIFCTAANSPLKEIRVRALGLFYYHTEDMGLDLLLAAIDCAVRKSVVDNIFLSRSHHEIRSRQIGCSC